MAQGVIELVIFTHMIKKFFDFKESKNVLGFIQKFPDWLPGVRIANGTALCH
jgi:hypothetical protein